MGRRLHVLIWIAATPWGRLIAQDNGFIAHDAAVESCPAADSAAGHHVSPAGDINVAYRVDIGTTIVGFWADHYRPHGRMRNVTGSAVYRGLHPPDSAYLNLQLDVADTVARPATRSDVTLIFDDSARTVAGRAVPSIYHVEVPTANVTYLLRLTRRDAGWLAGARRVWGLFGTDTFELDKKRLAGFRGLFLAAACGSHRR